MVAYFVGGRFSSGEDGPQSVIGDPQNWEVVAEAADGQHDGEPGDLGVASVSMPA